MARQTNPVNPDVLRWARETRGLTVEEVVRKLDRRRVDSATVEAWERGDESPTYLQLERLAYVVYRRPLALFFFPSPPEETKPEDAFRTLPDQEIQRLAPRVFDILRDAQVFQIDVAELCDRRSPAENHILKELGRFESTLPVDRMARRIRSFLGVELSTQVSWSNMGEALENWRNVLTESGVFVFKGAFKLPGLSGLCLYDTEFPIIYVNNSTSESRQIFTLFHELAHLLFGTGGIDTRLDDYLHYLKGDARRIEVKCNRFAAEFLVPDSDFRDEVKRLSFSETAVVRLSRRYKVSREVILRRLLDMRSIDQSKYDQFVEKWQRESPKKKGVGGNYYLNQRAYLGRAYLELAFSQYLQGRISDDRLADYLRVSVSSLPGMEDVLSR